MKEWLSAVGVLGLLAGAFVYIVVVAVFSLILVGLDELVNRGNKKEVK